MIFDLKTLMLVNLSICFFMSVYLFFIWLNFRKHRKGIGLFLLGLAFFLFGVSGSLLQDILHPLITVSLGNTLIGLGIILFYCSFRRFYSLPVSLKWRIFFTVLLVCIFVEQTIFSLVIPLLIVRLIVSNLVSSFLFFLSFYQLYKTRERSAFPGRILMGSFLLITLLTLGRTFFSLFIPPDTFFFMDISGWNSISVYLVFMLILSWPIGFTLLISQEERWREIQSRKEKEMLLKELYHRTKNNMNVIISMMELHKDHSASAVHDGILQEMQDRIFSMSLVHDKLYSSRDLSSIPLDEYIRELVENLNHSVSTSVPLRWNIDVDSISLLIDYAIPCGLLLNELISNSLKHAFSDDIKKAEIGILCYRSKDQRLVLEYRDNGKGLPENFEELIEEKMGMQLIRNITENQLMGEFSFFNENGLLYRISFADDQYQNRV